jgi:BirA family transcriptional regulator, biotin operon repressor / biotin---[acetyl-CoA-carboxylase] ligase
MANTLFTGKVYLRFDELGSTNDYALEWLAGNQVLSTDPVLVSKSKPPEGTVVRADRQSAGRGQFGSIWEAEAGSNVLCSVIWYPHWLAPQRQFYLSMSVALAVADTVAACLPEAPVRVKWPNDVYIGPQKTAGILIQNSLSGNRWQSAVVGVGINVNQTVFPAHLARATSLHIAAGHPFDTDQVFDGLMEQLEKRYLQLKSGQSAGIHAEYEQRLLGRGDTSGFLRLANQSRFEGVIEGVDDSGRLRVRTADRLEVFDLKEISWEGSGR